MANYSDEDFAFAGQIMSRIIQRVKEFSLPNNLSVHDVENDTEEFLDDVDFLDAIDQDMPSMRVGNNFVPVLLSSLFGSNLSPDRHWYFRRTRYSIREQIARYGNGQFSLIKTNEAREIFQQLATDFLATRISEIGRLRNIDTQSTLNLFQRLSAPTRITVPGCKFKVFSKTHGLRVHWSGAYVIAGKYFDAPTSPAEATLQAGTYVFGVDGGAYSTIQWDSAIVTIPGKTSVKLNY